MGIADFLDAARARVEAGAYDLDGPRFASNGGLAVALDRRAAVIAELKPRSPSEGRLLHVPPAVMLEAYLRGGAAALSVLADADHFDGSPALVREAHATGLPILWKDFVIDAAQVRCAAHCGASAVLLIERCFEAAADREALVEAAHEAGLEVLLEVHGTADWQRAHDSTAELIGVNARDLDTLDVDVPASLGLVRTIADAGRSVVALSGVRDRADRQAATDAGAAAVLVGTSLMVHPAPDLALRALQRPLAKVCGVTRAEDIDLAAGAGADLVGFVVGAPKSPRAVTPSEAQVLRDHAVAAGLRTVLVTPHEDAGEVRDWCRVVRPDLVQLHRLRPDPEWVHSLGAVPTHVLHAVHLGDPIPADGAGFVVDTPSKTGGGSGRTHDWAATARIIETQRGRMNLVAGGLGPDNAAEAVRTTGAWGADASSRLESEPRIKDAKTVQAYVQAVHEAHD